MAPASKGLDGVFAIYDLNKNDLCFANIYFLAKIN